MASKPKKSCRKPTSSRARNRRLARRANPSSSLGFEALEDRRLLATLTVGNSSDLVDGDTLSIASLIAAPGADGISLREAITASNRTDGADTITFDSAVFTGGANSLIRLTDGELDINETLTIDASTATDVTITGDANGDDVVDASFITDVTASLELSVFPLQLLDDNSRVFGTGNSFEPTEDLTLTGLTITGGVADNFVDNEGGGISFTSDGQLSLTDTKVSGNFAGNSGGGIFARLGSVTLNNSEISGNRSSGTSFDRGSGGGIFVDDGSLTLNDSTVSGNVASGRNSPGGGIAVSRSPLTLTDSVVSDNFTNGERSPGGGIFATRSPLVLVNTTVSGNYTTQYDSQGGGISSRYEGVTLTNSTISGNSTQGSDSPGGGVYARDRLYSLALFTFTVTDSTVTGNSTSGDGSNGGGIRSQLPLTMTDSVVSDNSTAGEYDNFSFNPNGTSSGGGISTSETLTLTNTTVQGNSTLGRAARGGGISAGELILTNSIVSGNSTAGDSASGGGISAFALTSNRSTVRDNTTAGVNADGGGISTYSGGTLTNSTVNGNSTSGSFADGGGISVRAEFSQQSSSLTLRNTTVSGNLTTGANAKGGAISVGVRYRSARIPLSLANSTIVDNASASDGGGVYIADSFRFAPLTITNTILAGNVRGKTADTTGVPSDLVPDPDVEPTISYSVIGAADNIAQTITGNVGNQFGTLENPLDPMLAPLADNGGPTQTHALLLGSPAFDAGGDFLAVDGNGNTLLSDQRGAGFDRVLGSSVDIGAFELDPSDFPAAPIVVSTVRDEGGVLARPDLLTSFTATFDVDVNVAANDLGVFSESFGVGAVDLSAVTFDYDEIARTATWDFSSLALEAAFYSFELSDNIVSMDAGVPLDGNGDGFLGGDYRESVYVAIPGDANLDGGVTVLGDAVLLINNLGTVGAATWAQGDFNGDGNVDVLGDASILVSQLGQFVTRVLVVENSLDVVNGDTSSVPNLINFPGADGISLREAIIAGNNTPVADSISFETSIFTGGANSLIRLTSGELEITDTLAIDGSTGIDITITGDADADDITNGAFITDVAASFGDTTSPLDDLLDDNSRVLNFTSQAGDLMLTGLTITGGRTTTDNENFPLRDTTYSGAGIRFVSSGQLAVTDSSVSGNSTLGRFAAGGAIYNASGSVILTRSTISENSTGGNSASGGGIATDAGSVVLTDSTVSENWTAGTSSRGGGISSDSGEVLLNDSFVSGNFTAGVRSSYGGGIYTDSGAIVLVDSAVNSNFTEGFNGQGGGISTRTGAVTLDSSRVNDNSTAGELAIGGGIRSVSGAITLVDSTVNRNQTTGDTASGGGMITNSGTVTLTNSTVSENSTVGDGSAGGGIFIRANTFDDPVSVTINQSTVSENSTAGGTSPGGGIYTQAASVMLTDSTVSGNSTEGRNSGGGGIFTESGQVSVLGSTISENSTAGTESQGGGIFSGHTATVTSSTISGNFTVGLGSAGGGIFAEDNSSLTLTSSTVTENASADAGGGIFAGTESFTIDSSIVAGNFQDQTPDTNGTPNDLAAESGALAIDSSLIGAIDNFFGTISGGGNQFGVVASPLDPLLGPLADNGGPTLTHALLPGSPAIDAGNSTEAFDQRGFARVVDQPFVQNAVTGNGSDIGAVEFENAVLIVTTSDDELDLADTDLSTVDINDLSLREAVAISNATPGGGGITFAPTIFTGGVDSLIRLTDGELVITSSVTIDASSAIDVTITADANADDVTDAQFITDVTASFGGVAEASDDLLDDNSRVFNFTGETGNLTLAGLTITGGRTTADSETGGGIRFDSDSDGVLSVIDSTVAGNSTIGNFADGGGIHSILGAVTVIESTIIGNSTAGSDADGGGLANANGDVDLTDTTLVGNFTSGSRALGGGIFADFGDVSLTRGIVSGNVTLGDASNAGAIYVDSGDLVLINSAVTGNSTSGDDASGGAIYVDSGDLNLTDSVVSENFTSGNGATGGGVFVDFGDFNLTDSSVSGNFTSGDDAHGGGIYVDSGDVNLTNSTVSGNHTSGETARGGGVYIDSGDLNSTNSTISENHTSGLGAEGGGVFVDFGEANLVDASISGNFTSGDEAYGGGVNIDFGDLSLTNSTISDNDTSGQNSLGGGIYLDFGDLTSNGSTISGNVTSGVAAHGGGIFTDASLLTLVNTTVSGNSTSGQNAQGGGIYSTADDVVLTNSTIFGNASAGLGGGLISTNTPGSPTLTLANSILAGNFQNQAADSIGTPDDLVVEDEDVLVTIDHSLIGVADNITQTITGNIGNQFGTAASPLDPLLGPLTDNGGATETHTLLVGSPAIDAGSDALAMDEAGNPLTTDQRGTGFDRVSEGSVDIGAFELDPNSLPDAPAVISTARDEGGVLARPDLLTTFSVTFDADVNVQASDFSIVNETLGGVSVDLSAITFAYDVTNRSAFWDFSTLELDPAFYSFVLSENITLAFGNAILDGDGDGDPGGSYLESVYVAILGDANLDGQVTVLGDASLLVQNLGAVGEAMWGRGDFNGDRKVDVLGDAAILVAQLGQSVVPPVTGELADESLVARSFEATDVRIDAAFEDEDLLGEDLLNNGPFA